MRPTEFMAWRGRDRLLAEALLEYEDSFCPGCGQPKDKAWDPASNGAWEAESIVCESCAAMQRAENETKEPEPGSMQYAVFNEDDYERAKARGWTGKPKQPNVEPVVDETL